jgi:hypothetical protein
MRLVNIESPFAGNVALNTAYARVALRHSLMCGEAPIASHLLHPLVLDDLDPAQRKIGIDAGLAWRKAQTVECFSEVGGEVTHVLPAFYLDLGLSGGMRSALRLYAEERIPLELRWLFADGADRGAPGFGDTFYEIAKYKHSHTTATATASEAIVSVTWGDR